MSDPVSDYVLGWLRDERDYTAGKYGLDNDDAGTLELGVEYWSERVQDRLHRATLLGIDTPVGRQAFAKVVSTAMMGLESVDRTHGELPEPGVTSGENLDRPRGLDCT